MKKAIICATALLFSGAMMAQNTSTSTQSGDDQRVYVRQAGSNSSAVTQGNGSGLGSNKAQVWQRGVMNSSTVDQEGTNNQALVKQGVPFTEPNNDTVVINQGKTDTASMDNKAHVYQHGGNNSSTTVDQDGDLNEAYAHQDGVGGTNIIDQDGTGNAAAIFHVTSYSESGNDATIVQNGTDNASYGEQKGNDNTLNANQTGSDNKSDQVQDSRGAASGNTATVNQSSSGNKARQRQVGGGNTATGIQHAVTGPGVDNYLEQNQYGNSNTAYSDQDGDGGQVRQDQIGNGNSATANQWAAGTGNKIYQRQFGDGNTVTSGQFGGSNNLASTYQDNGNWGSTYQNGDNNQALLVQKGGHSGSISQTGNGNMADVLQLGPGGDFAADGEGCDFQAPLPLNCPTPLPEISIDAPCGPAPGC